ncbi:lyase family protein [Streptomyces chiangmaiensis]
MYAHLWGTFETRALFEETGRLQSWLDILVALARAQADLGIIPRHAADAIAGQARVELLDLDHVAEETRRTSHSTLGLIRGLQQILPEQAREHVYFGATVQDLTDTWFGIVMREVGSLLREDLRSVEAVLLQLASRHRDTVMAGRTHGQPGAPVTFGFKVAGWADEIRRHIERLHEGRDRWAVGQLGGAVGVLGFFEGDGLELRRLFCRHLRLADPGISWLTSRDRPAEFAGVLAMICGTLARVGADVYELQRPEIGELREPAPPAGSAASPCRTSATRRTVSTSTPWLGWPGATRGSCWRAWSSSTNGTAGAGRPSGWPCRRSACSPLVPCVPPTTCSPGSRWTRTPWRPT